MKHERNYEKIERFTQKAVLILLDSDDTNPVWFPLSRIDLDQDAKTVAATEKLWAEKDADRDNFVTQKIPYFGYREREASVQAGKELVEIGGELHPGGKAVIAYGSVDEDVTNQEASRRFYFQLSQCVDEDGTFFAPRWLVEAMAAEVVYNWVSNRGSKGIDHMGGAVLTATINDTTTCVDYAALKKAERRAT